MTIQDLFYRMLQQERMVVAIDGPSGTGKSTLAQFLKEHYHATVFHTDDYFLPPEKKTTKRLNQAGGNLDHERMIREVFNQLGKDKIQSHHFNCQTNQLEKREPVSRQNIVVIEGVYSMHPLFQRYYDYMVFIDIDQKDQHNRIETRSNATMLQRFIEEWIPLEDAYFTAFDLRKQADIYWHPAGKITEIFPQIVV